MLVRRGNPGFNNIEGDRTFKFREEKEWPLARTEYTKFYLNSDLTLSTTKQDKETQLTYSALDGDAFSFSTAPFEKATEIAGHVLANLVMGVKGASRTSSSAPAYAS